MEGSWQEVSTWPRPSEVLLGEGGLKSIKEAGVGIKPIRYRARLNIPGLPLLPEQVFIQYVKGDRFVIENQPIRGWPEFQITCLLESNGTDFAVKDPDFVLRVAEDTVEAWLLYTRVIFGLEDSNVMSIESDQFGQILAANFKMLEKTEKIAFLQMARLIHKLKFIERAFNVQFTIPDIISWQDMTNAEVIFRGITEGKFTLRGSQYTYTGISAADLQFGTLPFNSPGSFSSRLGTSLNLLGKRLLVGPVRVQLGKAELTSPRVADRIRKGLTEPLEVRFEVLDNQITYCFETYAKQPRKKRLQKLNQFKKELAREEPEALVHLIDESLQGDVSSDEAYQIAVGWMQYNDLPDRYCPQEAQFDSDAPCWRVPVHLVYPNGEGGPVGELVINSKTGKIIQETPVEELRSRGRALAEQILHGRQTSPV